MRGFLRLLAGAILSAVVTVPFGGCAVAGDVKIGYIDVTRILEEYEDFKEARADLDNERKDREEQLTRKVEELQKLGKELKEKASILSEAKRKAKEQDFMKKQQDLEAWRAAQSKELAEKEEGLVKRLEADVRKVLDKLAEKEKMAFVVRRDLFLYMQPGSKDLTSSVLAELRKQKK